MISAFRKAGRAQVNTNAVACAFFVLGAFIVVSDRLGTPVSTSIRRGFTDNDATGGYHLSHNSTTMATSVSNGFQDDFEASLAIALKEVAIDSAVVATTASKEFALLLGNWLCHLRRLGIRNVLVFALDQETVTQATKAGVTSVLDQRFAMKPRDGIGTWNSDSYNQVVYAKSQHQLAVLSHGYSILFSDVDIPWTADWQTQLIDVSTANNLDLMIQLNWPFGDLNIGFFLARSNPTTLRMFQLLVQLEEEITSGRLPSGTGLIERDDQTCFMFLLFCGLPNGTLPTSVSSEDYRKYLTKQQAVHLKGWPKPNKPAKTHLRFTASCPGTGVALSYGVLPPGDFQTGHWRNSKRAWGKQAFSNRSLMYHGNFLKGAEAKIAAFKDRNRWIPWC